MRFRHFCMLFPLIAHTNPGDHMLNSIWTDNCPMPGFPSLETDTKTDVLIIGGGMAGLLTAYKLHSAGISCLLIEADSICAGVTRNTTAKITSQHGLVYDALLRQFGADTAQLYWQANEDALAQYRMLSQKTDCDFEEKDSYVYTIHHPDKLEKEMAALQKLHIPGELTQAVSLPFSTAGAIRFRHQAQFHPLKFVAEICRELDIREHTRALAFEGNTVITDRGTIQADRIIIATHFPMLNKHGSYFLKLYQQRSYVLALKNAPKLDGMYRDEAEEGLSLRSFGDYLLLGGGSHRTGKQSPGWLPLETAAQKYYPEARPVCYWATQDCMSLDKMPYIGQYSARTPNVYVAAGFNKWGMTGSMTAATVLGNLLQGKPDPYHNIFSPSRTILRKQLFINGFSAATNLLTPTAPRCPHLGCALKWNRQEHSWDCPCHGSRFAKDGKLLDNPATGDLKINNDR